MCAPERAATNTTGRSCETAHTPPPRSRINEPDTRTLTCIHRMWSRQRPRCTTEPSAKVRRRARNLFPTSRHTGSQPRHGWVWRGWSWRRGGSDDAAGRTTASSVARHQRQRRRVCRGRAAPRRCAATHEARLFCQVSYAQAAGALAAAPPAAAGAAGDGDAMQCTVQLQ
jgi:hypothetical protein